MILEAFAGPGGISEALRMVLPDVPALGIDLDADACATAEAAGHERLQADVSMLDLRPYVGRVVGFCAGPPCQSFSAAGRQLGKLDKPRIVAHIDRIRKAGRWLHYSREGWHDPRSPLVLEVLRYALTLRPEWVVLEQVPAVLPLWELVAEVLRDHGWHVETRVLKAEQHGVPQTRKRAILAARMCLPGCPREPSVCVRSRGLLPAPTHRPYRKGVPRDAGDLSLLPWVSMADALCRMDDGWVLRSNYGTSGDPASRGERGLGEPAATVTSKVNRNQFVRFGNQEHSAIRSADGPAATVRFSERINAIDWVQHVPRSSAYGERPGRPLGEPSFTITGSGRNGGGAHHAPEFRSPGQPNVRVSVQEAAVLQSFPADYPWRGSRTAQYRQVGDSAPPVLMAAVISSLTKR